MPEHRIQLSWQRSTPDFSAKTYSRDHRVTFKNRQALGMSAAPAYRGNPAMVDPEEAFVASLSSCHMLTFLFVAASRKLVIDSYEDDAVGHLEKNSEGRLAITRVVLRPKIKFAGQPPDAATLRKMHESAHHDCFIASSVKTDVTVEPA
jgi:organic hydroperoxide reductase OsmC/OhrA